MKFKKIILVLILAALFLAGCSANNGGAGASASPSNTATGGVSQPAQNINLKDIDITADGDASVVTLSLLSGSRKAGYAETKLTKLPEYEVSLLPEPQRLMIKLHNISFWDYTEKSSWVLSDFILGVFREVPAGDNSLIIYVQLSRNAEFSVEESEGNLIIKLIPGKENEGTKFYCLSDSFFEHQEGTWPDDIDMSPVLCSGLANKLLISKPFSTKDEANAFLASASEELKSYLPDNSIYVMELIKGALPEYSSAVDPSEVEEKSIVMKQGVIAKTPALLQNGRYLSTASDGRVAFTRTYKPEEPALSQESYLLSEKLWIMDPNGRVQKLDIPDFYSIDSAAFSPDGKYLAVLDVSIENKVLYVYDFTKEELYNLGEEGFGSQTSSFAWSDEYSILYAMSGTESMQMMKCTFQSDGNFQIAAVEEKAGSEGIVKVTKGRLFFDSLSGNSGTIYEIGESRRTITDGVDFTISPDGKTLLVLETSATQGEDILTSLKLCDIDTGKTTYIEKDKDICDFGFSQNGGKVYYSESGAEGATDEFPFGFYSYDIASGTSQLAALCSTCDFAAAPSPGIIYLIFYFDKGNDSFYATYEYDLSK